MIRTATSYPPTIYKKVNMRKFATIERYLKATVLGDFYLVLKTPVDKESVKATRSYDYQSTTRQINQNFTDYIFHDLIISTKK